jgi:hypothetical protein
MDNLSFDELVPSVSEKARAALVAADVVIGIDRDTDREFTIFGMPSLETTTLIRQPSAMQILRVLLDCNNKELDRLLVLVRDVKGLDAHKHAKV